MYFIDMQGFQFKTSKFVCKEISVLNSENIQYKHTQVSIPFPLEMFGSEVRNHMNWLTNNIHGLSWEGNELSEINQEEIANFILEFLTMDNSGNIICAVKGRQKKVWLEGILNGFVCTVIDLEEKEKDIPSMEKLKTILKSYHCCKHSDNMLNCSLEHVFFMYLWCTYCQKNK